MCKKKFFLFFVILAVMSCENVVNRGEESIGAIRIGFVSDNPTHFGSKSGLPDTNRFILTVADVSGNVIYKGLYGDAPDKIIVNSGNYAVSVVSAEFPEPCFDKPQYGDNQVVIVPPDQTVEVLLDCVQLNSGIKLNVSRTFIDAYPEGNLYLKSSTGMLMYGYYERRTAYFEPGPVTLSLNDGEKLRTLFTRVLEARQVLVVNISSDVLSSEKTGISMRVDTSRNWANLNYIFEEVGAGQSGGDEPMGVAEAIKSAGANDVWVYGYIVGGDLTSSRCSFDPPFSSRTNLVLATKSSCREKASCLSVQLSAGDVRDALNLVDNPSNLGRQIRLKGDIVPSYYGIVGIQGISEYKWN